MRAPHLLTGSALAAALLMALAPAANADSTREAAGTVLFLTVAQGHEPTTPPRLAVLTCGRVDVLHARAREACRALSWVRGDIAGLKPAGPYICTLDYNPQTVTAKGVFRGKKVDFSATYSNRCTLATETGPVFDF